MYSFGIDLGGTNIVAGVVDENLRVIAKGKVKTNSPRPANEIADDMAKATQRVVISFFILSSFGLSEFIVY
mgnify:CR=1 FL=1